MDAYLDKALLFRIFDQVEDAVMFLDINRRVEYLNKAAALLFETDSTQSLGASADSLLLPAVSKVGCEEFFADASKKGSRRENMVHVRRDGTKIHAACSVSSIADDVNNSVGFFVLIHDISEFSSENDSGDIQTGPVAPYFILGELHKMEAVGRLAGIIAHDFNNYLAGILGNISVAVRKLDAAHPVHHLLLAAQGSAERGSALVKQLLSFARHHAADFSQVNLNDTLEELRDTAAPADKAGPSLTFSLDAELPTINGDAAQIIRAVTNLVLNAQEVSDDNGVVRVQTKKVIFQKNEGAVPPGTYVLLEIEDNGRGMDSETKSHMFEPFFSTKEHNRASDAGLGLSIVWGIVRQHHGYIDVDSQLGQGTRFRVYFPAYGQHNAAALASLDKPASQNFNRPV